MLLHETQACIHIHHHNVMVSLHELACKYYMLLVQYVVVFLDLISLNLQCSDILCTPPL
jgi:hypothetical protein